MRDRLGLENLSGLGMHPVDFVRIACELGRGQGAMRALMSGTGAYPDAG